VQNDICAASDNALEVPTDQRLFAIANALHTGYTVERIWQLTKIDRWFLNKLLNIVRLDQYLSTMALNDLTPELVRRAKQLGFADSQVARCVQATHMAVRKLRTDWNITPFVKQIDTGTTAKKHLPRAVRRWRAACSPQHSVPLAADWGAGTAVAAEFPAYTNYLYMTYHGVEHDVSFDDHGIMVLGSGVYRIGRYGPAHARVTRRTVRTWHGR